MAKYDMDNGEITPLSSAEDITELPTINSIHVNETDYILEDTPARERLNIATSYMSNDDFLEAISSTEEQLDLEEVEQALGIVPVTVGNMKAYLNSISHAIQLIRVSKVEFLTNSRGGFDVRMVGTVKDTDVHIDMSLAFYSGGIYLWDNLSSKTIWSINK